MLRYAFHCMGTEVELVLRADTGAEVLPRAEGEFHRLDALLSRFRADSELSRLNRLGSCRVGPELIEILHAALEARERTGGRFDPTVHDALVGAGYDRTFELVSAGVVAHSPMPASCGGEVFVDEGESVVEVEPGYRLDLGGIAKGYAADRVLALLAPAGPALVDAGGDIAVTGGSWTIGVETRDGSVVLELDEGSVATSGRDRRRWFAGGEDAHHLIDPATGKPAEGDLLRVTAVAATGIEAEVLATALFLAGDVDDAAAEADVLGVPAILVADDGRAVLTGGLT
jgi:thiamine biosynthesis lipoprotein